MGNYRQIAFLFPGQGAQYPGMGKDVVERYSAARLVLEEADDLLQQKLSSIIFQGPEALLTETRNSQVAIFVISIAFMRVLEELFPSLKPHFCAGLSLGEYTALTAAGYLSFRDCLSLVRHRANFMNEACERHQGTMAVVMGLDADVVEAMVQKVNLPQDLWAANFNCPGQVVVSGTLKGIAAATEAAKTLGAKRVLPLTVHGAFHSGLMKTAEDRLSPYINDVPISSGKVSLVMNVPGDFVQDVGLIRQNLIKQVTSPVRWEQGIRAMEKKGVDLFIEIGCGKTLSGMNKRIGVQAQTFSFEKIDDLDILAKTLG